MFPFKDSNLCPVCNNPPWRHKSSCLILKRILAQSDLKNRITSNEIFGSTPPSLIVGEYAYPKVNAGILLPPVTGNTSIYDSPKTWYQKRMSIEDVFQFRIALINARKKFQVSSAVNPDRDLEIIQEIAASSTSLDTEVKLKKKPKIAVYFDPHAPPYGPIGLLEKANITENPKIDRKVDYVISDLDLKAQNAVLDLYQHGYDVYQISKILSVGLLGMKIQRKLVPTKWSITATDSIIANKLLKEVKEHQLINEYRLFEANYMGNYFEILLLPTPWVFEQIEMAVPGGVWVGKREEPIIISDHEFYWGRKDYASNVAGAYYAAKLALLEYLSSIKKQAGVLIVREIRPEYYAPIGVWKIRECVRDAMRTKPLFFNNLIDAIERINEMLIIKSSIWSKKSKIIDLVEHQRKIEEYTK